MADRSSSNGFIATRALPLIIILFAFGLRLAGLDAQSLWVDEGISVQVASHSPLEILRTVARTDVHPPLHYLALHVWQTFAGASEFAVRFLSLILSVSVAPLLMVLTRRSMGAAVALAAGALAAVSPLGIAYAQEARMYAMVSAFSMASMLCFDGILKGKRLATPGYVVATVLAVYTQYYAGLVVLAQAAYLALLWLADARARSLQAAARWLGALGAVAVLFLPWLPTFLGPLGWWRNAWVTPVGPADFALQVWQALNAGPALDPAETAPLLGLVMAVVAVGLAVGWRADAEAGRMRLMVAAALIVPVVVLFYLAQTRGIFQPKYLLPVAPLYLVVPAHALVSLARKSRFLGAAGGAVVLAAVALGLAGYHSDSRFTKDQFREMAAYVGATAGPGDLVIVDNSDTFGYYYTGAAKWAVLPAEYPLNEDRLATDLAQLTAGRGGQRVFLGQWSAQECDPKGYLAFLLEAAAQPLETVRFGRQALGVYRLPQEPEFGARAAALPAPLHFGTALELDGWEAGTAGGYGSRSVASGGRLWVSLDWRLAAPLGRNLRVSLKLLNPDGRLAGQTDRSMWNNAKLPVSRWSAGERVTDGLLLDLLPAVPPGEYRLEISVYDAGDGRQLALTAPGGANAIGLTAELGRVAVTQQTATPPTALLDMETSDGTSVCGGAVLLGFDGPADELAPGESAAATLFWQAGATPAEMCRRGLRLRDSAGSLVAESWAPVGGSYPAERWSPGEVVRDWAGLTVPAALTPGAYRLTLAASGGTQQQEIALGRVEVTGRRREFAAPRVSQNQSARLGQGIRLVGWETDGGAGVRPGGTLRVTLVWSSESLVDRSYTVFTHLVDDNGRMAGQQDGLPHSGEAPTSGWVPGEYIIDTHSLVVRSDAAAGLYRLVVGMYDLTTMQRLAVTPSPGSAVNDHVVLGPGTIRVTAVP